MESTAAFTIAPAHSTMTRTMSYSWAVYYDAKGRELDLPPFGRRKPNTSPASYKTARY